MKNPFGTDSLPATRCEPYCVFLIEDDKEAELMQFVLEKAGFFVMWFSNSEEAEAAVASVTPDLMIAGRTNDGLDGRALISSLKKLHPRLRKVPVILLVDNAISWGSQIGLAPLEIRWILEKPLVTASLPKLVMRTINQPSQSGIRPASEMLPKRIGFGATASSVMNQAVG